MKRSSASAITCGLAADYRLITDNLIDLSHVPYLHTGLLANREAVVAEVNVVS